MWHHFTNLGQFLSLFQKDSVFPKIMTTSGNTVICVFCFDESTDVYQRLECGHTCCCTCAKPLKDLPNNVECPKCRKTAKVVSADVCEKIPRETAFEGCNKMCDRCQVKPAKVFCMFCQLLLCQDHMQDDQVAASRSKKPSHYHVQIRNFLANTDFYMRNFCKEHTNLEASEACLKCLKTFCKACNITDRCKYGVHEINAIADVVIYTKSKIEEIKKLLSEKVEKLSLFQKVIITGIKQVNDDATNTQEEVARMLEEQNYLTNDGERVKSEIMEFASDNNAHLELKSKQAKALEEEAVSYMFELTDIKNMASYGRLLERCLMIEERVSQLLSQDMKPVNLPKLHVMQKSGNPGSLQVTYLKIPNGMEHESSIMTSKDCYWSVRWIDEGLLATGSGECGLAMREGGVELRDRQLRLIRSTELKDCMDIIPYKNQLLVLECQVTTKKISRYSQRLEKLWDIVYFPAIGSFSQIAACDDKIYASDPRRKCAYEWTINGQLSHTIDLRDMADPRGLCVTADGCLIVSDCSEPGSVQKFQLEGDYTRLWKCADLIKPYGIAEDCTGLIYVSRLNHQNSAVYLLSPDGQLLKDITCDELKGSMAYGISVLGDRLAVACGTTGLKLFQLSY